jgi:Rieske [2Fe-2S] domain
MGDGRPATQPRVATPDSAPPRWWQLRWRGECDHTAPSEGEDPVNVGDRGYVSLGRKGRLKPLSAEQHVDDLRRRRHTAQPSCDSGRARVMRVRTGTSSRTSPGRSAGRTASSSPGRARSSTSCAGRRRAASRTTRVSPGSASSASTASSGPVPRRTIPARRVSSSPARGIRSPAAPARSTSPTAAHTHLTCPVLPAVEREELICPCHHGVFELRTGRPIAGPPRRPLARVTLEVRDGWVLATGIEARTV